MASMVDLPEDIIGHISSFLSYKQAAKTSVLSKSWLNAWRARPTTSLTLDYNNFRKELKTEGQPRWHKRTKGEGKRKFSKYVRRTLKSCTKEKIGINLFKLIVSDIFFDWNSLVKRCLQVAVKSGVKKLYLDLYGCALPEIFFEAKSLVDLGLRGVGLVEQSMEKIKGFDHLKRLSLCIVDLDNVTFERMMSSCQQIEILEISYCYFDDEYAQFFDVPDLDDLRKLTVQLNHNQSLILHEAPNLESLFCSSNEDFMHDIDDWAPCWLDLRSSQYKNLMTLVLYAVGHCYKVLIQMEHKFPCLEDLTIQYCQDLKRIKIKSDSLKTIQLADNWGLNKAQFDTPSIVHFVFADSQCKIIPKLSFIAASGHWASHISITWNENLDTSWLFKFQRLLASLVQSQISVSLQLWGSISFDFNEIGDNLTSHEPQEVHELTLDIHRESLLSSPVLVLDALFWVCRPKTIRQHWGFSDGMLASFFGRNIETLKLLYDMLILRNNQELVNSLQQLKSWQDNLEGLKVGIFKSRLVWISSSRKYYAGQQREQQLEALDWENFLKVVNTHSDVLIHFGLDWKASVKPEGTKRKATDKPKEEKS